MSQRKYVRMSEQSHMQLRLLAATIDRSVPDVCEMLVDYALETLDIGDVENLSMRELREAANRFEGAMGLAFRRRDKYRTLAPKRIQIRRNKSPLSLR